ncbi:MAG: GTPase ObgE [Verrucomicrobiae bacterium]|nr:GTPase ObgE [Verrucomicrobiae bacterium]
MDKVKVFVRAGNGGNGCVSFRREKYVEHGGPDGGDGGKGGDVILIADGNVSDLSDLYYAPRLIAQNGQHGRGKNCFGRNGKDVIVKVPVGTQVYALSRPARVAQNTRYHPAAATEKFDAHAPVGLPYGSARQKKRGEPFPPPAMFFGPQPSSERVLLADLVEHGQRVVLARGGRGGRGNAAFKSATHQAPREFEYGEPGEELIAELELKTIADVGLVGFPNAGKSTLISKLTHARPKVAPYPFTTLSPHVGILEFDDHKRVRIADIPGLIEGAHAGKGLGHDFLRHIERCRLLLILVDMAGVDGRKPWEDYRQLLSELELHNPALLDKLRLVVANKMDLPAAKKNLAAFKRYISAPSRTSNAMSRGRTSQSVAPRMLEVSALTGEGLEKLKLAIRRTLR